MRRGAVSPAREQMNVRLPPDLDSCRLLPQLKFLCCCGTPRSAHADLRQPLFGKKEWRTREQPAGSLTSRSLRWRELGLVVGLQSKGNKVLWLVTVDCVSKHGGALPLTTKKCRMAPKASLNPTGPDAPSFS